jgi:carboxyl-terminal processing protease
MNFLNAERRRHLSTAVVVIIIFLAGFALGNQYAVGNAQGDTSPPPDAQKAFEPFWQVYNLIQSDYIDEIDVEKLVDSATRGLVDALDDPYSGYMNAELYALTNSDLEGEFDGIGVVIHTIEETGQIEVVGLLEGAPAAGSGIQPGDIFAAVDGIDVTHKDQTELAALVRGPEGTDVTITMLRGDERIDFVITRAHITVPNIESRVLDNNIGYIKLNQFSATARNDIDGALEAIDVNNRAGLIFDLRDNPGGYLNSAIDVASAFIKSGTVVIEDFGGDNEHTYEATGDYAEITVRIAVLVNESSASASELVAGALQDRQVATIIGATTLGKGTVQTWHELVNEGAVRLTIARWLTPNGRWIHEQGITPDIAVDWERVTFTADEPDPQLDAAIQFLETEVLQEPAISTPVAESDAQAG